MANKKRPDVERWLANANRVLKSTPKGWVDLWPEALRDACLYIQYLESRLFIKRSEVYILPGENEVTSSPVDAAEAWAAYARKLEQGVKLLEELCLDIPAVQDFLQELKDG